MITNRSGEDKDTGENAFLLKRWWFGRSIRERRLTIAFSVFVVILIIAILLYVFLISHPKICTSTTCVRTAMELLNHIDVRVNPCEDFYKFSCGNFLKNTNLDRQGSRSVQDIMKEEIQSQIRDTLEQPIHFQEPRPFNLAKKFYRACMNESAIEAEGLKWMKQIFRQMGGWPTLEGENWSESDFDWKDAIHKLRKIGINFEFFIILSVVKDKMDPAKYILKFEDPKYGTSSIEENIKNIYLEYMEDVAVYFGASRSVARMDQIRVLEFLLILAQYSEASQATNKTNLYNPMSFSELQYLYNRTNWFDYVNGFLTPSSPLNNDDIISVSDPIYLQYLENLLNSTPKRILANFIAWHTLQHLTNLLPSEIVTRAYDYLVKINGDVSKKRQRWPMCVQATKERLGSVISATYIQKHFDDNTRQDVMDMVRNIKIQFKYTVMQLEWIDEQTKSMTLEKLLESVDDIAPYNEITDNMQLNNIYNDAKIYEDNLLSSALNLDLINMNRKFGKLHEPVKDNWLEDPSFVTGLNIIFSRKDNSLRFPIGILRGPYYQRERPRYMNYGALGSIIAHKVWHTFIEAEYRNLKGDLRSWWSPGTLLNYEERLQCLSRQYRSLALPDRATQSGTSFTQQEDMADLAGIKVAYDAYNTWVRDHEVEARLPGLNFSPNQLYWISSAIHYCSKHATNFLESNPELLHSKEMLRVNGPLQNLNEFSYDFSCSFGDKMNAVEKCEVV